MYEIIYTIIIKLKLRIYMGKDISKQKKLILNTLILGLGVFGSKLLVFLMMPLYTGILSPAEYSAADLISQTANLLMPLACIGITDGVFRFAMDKEADKRQVLSSGLAVLMLAGLVFLALSPLIGFIDYFSDHVWLIAAYVISANIHALCAQYVRARDKTKLFALQGVINTALVIVLNILFLVVFKMGVTGYVLSVVVADVGVTVFLVFAGKLYNDIRFSAVRGKLIKDLLKYSIPMIPATIFWWITSVSDRYMVTYFSGEAENGLYSAAYKIPTILTLVSTVFMEAWQYSAVSDTDAAGKSISRESVDFFGKVFSHFQSIMYLAGSGIIAFSQIFIIILCADSYFEAWRFIPVLTLASVFSAFTSFAGSVYLVKKKSMLTLLTSMSGAVINIVLNLLLIPKIGAQGAAIATAVSYLAVFVIRAVNARRYVPFALSLPRMLASIAILTAQTAAMLLFEEYIILTQGISLALICAINLVPLAKGTLGMMKNRRKAK